MKLKLLLGKQKPLTTKIAMEEAVALENELFGRSKNVENGKLALESLTFIEGQMKVCKRKTPQYEKGETRMWDIGGDAFESSDGARILEIADLSLDEPELESMVFVDEEDDENEMLED
ncbi:uncharacterized protein [Euphorbia lathyris]|uniref:uncharacterized protein isoform X2 n=1 Tax=Euphorbia lathyris TaxID=212925 RepID=UPI0033138DE5